MIDSKIVYSIWETVKAELRKEVTGVYYVLFSGLYI